MSQAVQCTEVQNDHLISGGGLTRIQGGHRNIRIFFPENSTVFNLLDVRNHIKLEIHSFVMNFNSGGYGLADLHCRKVESTRWLKHKLRATIGGQ